MSGGGAQNVWRPGGVAIVTLFLGLTLAATALLVSGNLVREGPLARANALLLLGALAFAILILRFSAAGLPILVALVILNLSQALVRYHDFPSLLQVLVIVLAFAAWLKRETVPAGNVVGEPLTRFLGAYVLLTIVTTTVATSRAVGDARALELVKALVIYVLVTILIRDRKRLTQAMTALVASATLLGSLATFQALTGRFDLQFAGLARIKDAHIYGEVFQERIAGPVGDPNFFAQILLLVLPLAILVGFEQRRRLTRIFWLGAAAMILVASLLTYSRGAMIALAFIALALVRTLHIGWRKTAAAVGLLLLALVVLPRGITERFLTIEQILPSADAPLHPDSSFQERKLLMQVAWVMFGARPLLGVGVGNYTVRYDEYVDRVGSAARQYADPGDLHYPHNLILEVAAETGLAGLLLLAGVFTAAFVAAGRARRDALTAEDAVLARGASGLAIGMAGFLVTSLFLHLAFPRYLFLLFAFVAAFRRVAAEKAAQREPEIPASAAAGRVEQGRGDAIRARSPVAVLLSRFPKITETFILREIEELERQGQPVVLVPMIEERTSVVHEEAKPWCERALHAPLLSRAVLAATGRALVRQPSQVGRLLFWILSGSLHRPGTMAKSLLLVPKSIWLSERLRELGVGHLHAHFATHPATMARIIAALTGIPFSFTAHAHDIFVDRSLLREKIRDARFVRAISRFNRAFLRNLYPEEAADKIEVVHVGVPAKMFLPRIEGDAESTPVILCVAALEPYKGVPHLLEACRILAAEGRYFRTEIIGKGWMESQIRSEIDARGLADRVALRGAVPQQEVAESVRRCSLFVLPSVIAASGQMEGIPVSLMEAMAAERAVVATSISGIPELVEHGRTGILVDPANPVALAEAIRGLLDDPALRSSLGRAARSKVERDFELSHTVRALLEILDRHNPGVEIGELAVAAEAFPDARWGLRTARQGRDARVFELIASRGEAASEIVLKKHVGRRGESRPPETRAADEYAVLMELRSAFGQNGTLGFPEPLAAAQAKGIIILGRVRGRPMDELIRRARGDVRAAEDLALGARRAGEWLRKFQSVRAGDRSAAIEALVGRAVAACSRAAAGLETRQRALRRSIDDLHGAMAQYGPPAVTHHGDFWPGNLFVGAESLDVIDFEGVRLGLPEEDLGYFFLHLELYLAFRRPDLIRRIREGVLAGWNGIPGVAELRLATMTTALELLGRPAPAGLSPMQQLVRSMLLRRELRR